MTSPFRFVLLSSAVLAACLVASEIGRRVLDGYRVWSIELLRDARSTDLTWSDGRSIESLLRTIKVDLETETSWFYDRPQPLQGTSPNWADERRSSVDAAANYVFNAATLGEPGLYAYLEKNRERLDEIFVFRTPSGEPYPSYRLYPDIQSGFGFTNRFGWRSRQVATVKPVDVVRLGFLGDSTTNTYPALVEHWLNLWAARRGMGVHFEIAQAARPASGALDAAAIVEFELAGFDPDYLILYGFGNGVYVADALVQMPPGIVKGQPFSAPAAELGRVASLSQRVGALLEPLAKRSAAAGFLRSRVMGQRGSALSPEPAKPKTRIEFPPDLDEDSPDPDKIAGRTGGGLMALETYLQGLNKIDAIAKERGIRLFVSSFRIMAFEGMLLGKGDANNGGIIYDVINRQNWWPYTYAQIHRFIAFYNRSLAAWAKAKGHDLIPIDEQMPWRPELYGDGTHELPTGEALHAWIVLQQLMPKIRDDIAHHRLPRAGRPPRSSLDQYWSIERVNVTAALNKVATSTQAPADEIAGAMLVSKVSVAHSKAQVAPGGVPLITTAPEPSAYAATIPIEASASGQMYGKGWVVLRLRVNEGRVFVGALNKSAEKFVAQASLDRATNIQEVSLMIDDLSEVGSIMISNNRPGEAARSIAELHGVVFRRFRQ